MLDVFESVYNDEAIKTLQAAVQCNTVNPPGNEIRLCEKIKDILDMAGIECTVHSSRDGRVNLVSSISGNHAGENIVLSGHMDTVPIGDQPWKYPPFDAVIEDGRMYGRGTADMKSGLIALLYAFLSIKNVPSDQLKGTVWFAASFGEETGSEGAQEMVLKGQLPRFHSMIIAEPTDNHIVIAHKGVLWLQIESFGKTAHASMPAHGVNALENLHALHSELKTISFGHEKHTLLSPATLSVTTLQAGKNINVIPDYAVMGVDIRTLPQHDHGLLVSEIEAIAKNIEASSPDAMFRVTPVLNLRALSTMSSSPLVEAAQHVLHDCQLDTDLYGADYFTDASVFLTHGDNIIIMGPGSAKQAHQTDEYVEIADYLQAIEIYKKTILQLMKI